MEPSLEQPRQPRLKSPPLVLALCQLRYPGVLGFEEGLVRPIQVALADSYPDIETEDLQQVQFGAEGVTLTGRRQRIFRFRTHEKDWTATVGPASLSLETVAYDDFADFISRWAFIVEATAEALALKHQERIGLRYVNQIHAPAEAGRSDLLGLVRPELLGVVGEHPATERLTKSWQELRFHQEDGGCTVQHGYSELLNSGGRWAYTLDFDCYDDEGKPLDLQNQVRVLERFNHRTYELFKWAVNDELFKSFQPEERAMS